MAYVIETPNAFEPLKSIKHVVESAITIRDWVQRKYPDTGEFPVPTICLVNGEAVLREFWDRPIAPKDVVNFIAIPTGIETIILVVLVVVVVAITLITTLNQPKMPGEQPTSDPVFTIKGQQNAIRLGEPIEVNYGRNRIFPSYASRPYAEYVDNDQFHFDLFCIGQGEYEIQAVQIGDTSIDEFQEAEYEVVPPGEQVTLFPAGVYTAPEAGGQTLRGPNEPEYTADGWVGPFPVCAAGTRVTSIAVDVVMPKGLYRMKKSGGLDSRYIDFVVEIREIDDAGAPLGGYTNLTGDPFFHEEGATTTPQRKTYRADVTLGRYEARMRRIVDTDLSYNSGHEITWESLRGYLDVEQDFGNVTLLAVKIRATNNLNSQTQQRFNVIATRKLPIREASGVWSAPTATRSIVWAFVDTFRNSAYGGRVQSDAFFDWDELEELDALYTSREEYFDWTFRDPSTVWDAATAIARVGRAIPLLRGSLITMRRDGPLEIPSAVFNQENILKGSFEWGIKLWDFDEYDSMSVEYTDPTTGYKQETVTAVLPGGTTNHPEDVRFPGIQSRAHAYHEGMYMLAVRRYLRENFTFETGLEGYIPTFGELIAVVHDVPRAGQGGFIVQATRTTADKYQLWVSEPLTFATDQEHQIMLRGRHGEVIGPLNAYPTLDSQQIIIQSVEDIDFLLGGENEPMLFAFGVSNNITRYLRVVRIEPQGGEAIRITGVTEDARIHSFDELEPTPLAETTIAPVPPALPEIDEVRVSQIDFALHIVQVSWTAAFGAQYYIVQSSQDGTHWHERLTTTRTSIQFQTFPGDLYVRVAAVNEGQGPWTTASLTIHFILGLAEEIPWDDLVWKVTWQEVVQATGYLVKVYDNSSPSNPVLQRTETVTDREYQYTYAMALDDGNLVRDMLITVDPIFADEDGEDPSELELHNDIPSAPTGMASSLYTEDSDSVRYTVSWNVPHENDLIRLKVWVSAVNGFDPSVVSPVIDEIVSEVGWENIPASAIVDIPLDSDATHPTYYWRVAVFDVWGQEISSNVSSQQMIPAYP